MTNITKRQWGSFGWLRERITGCRLPSVAANLPVRTSEVRMPALKNLRRLILIGLILAVAVSAGWIYWNRPVRSEMAGWAAADSLAFVEIDDLAAVASGVGDL